MKRVKLSDRILPDYTKGEEIFNMVSHIVGGAVGIAGLVLCVIISAFHKNPWAVVGKLDLRRVNDNFVHNVKYISRFEPEINSQKSVSDN